MKTFEELDREQAIKLLQAASVQIEALEKDCLEYREQIKQLKGEKECH